MALTPTNYQCNRFFMPARRFRMLVGYPTDPLNFREINIRMDIENDITDALGKFFQDDLAKLYRKSVLGIDWGKPVS